VTLWSVFHHLHPHVPLWCQQEVMHIIVPEITEPDLHVHINMLEGKVKVFYVIYHHLNMTVVLNVCGVEGTRGSELKTQ
jgi:hypothetical protein